jgi:Calcium binding
MARSSLEKEHERRIAMEIILDAYGPEEQAAGWHVYLTDHLRFPFTAHCVVVRAISPLEVGDEVEVVEMASEEECQHEMFVGIRWQRRPFAAPLAQLEGVQVDGETEQALQDWHYWVSRGYELCYEL